MSRGEVGPGEVGHGEVSPACVRGDLAVGRGRLPCGPESGLKSRIRAGRRFSWTIMDWVGLRLLSTATPLLCRLAQVSGHIKSAR